MKKIKSLIFISSLLTFFCLIYFSSSCFQNSLIDAFLRTINIKNWGNVFYILKYFGIGYLSIFITYYILKYFLTYRKSKLNPLKLTTYFFIILISVFILNDQIIIISLRDYEYTPAFRVNTKKSIKIDSTNYFNFQWKRQRLEITPSLVFNETIKFKNDSIFVLLVDETILDRCFIFRRLFKIYDKYQFNEIIYKYKSGKYTNVLSNGMSSDIVYVYLGKNWLMLTPSFR